MADLTFDIGFRGLSGGLDPEDRVRVDGFSKIRATVRRSRAREAQRSAFSSSARSMTPVSSSFVSSAPVRKWRVTEAS